MAMTQDDIRRHYETNWKQAGGDGALTYSNPVEDAVLYAIYQRLIADHRLIGEGARILDVGSGSGRWIRFFLEWFKPARLMGVDFTASSVELLEKFHASDATRFRVADITQPELDLGEKFDLINIANVLFHIPENDRFMQALHNLRAHLAEGGRIVTTEYLPRVSMRTQWMLVRSRYEFEHAIGVAGLRIADIRASAFFANDPMGIDGPDQGTRQHFGQVRSMITSVLSSNLDANSKQFFVKLFSEVETACLSFCSERLAAIDGPSQKLVVLAAA